MTRREAKERRQQIARAMRKLKSVLAVAKEFNVSPTLVRKACREFGISPTGKRSNAPRVSKHQVVSELRTGKTADAVAEQYKVPVRRIIRLQERMTSGLPDRSR